MAIVDLLSFENAAFKAYVFWSAILVVKILSMALLTAKSRFKNQVFANPEDLLSKKHKVKFDDVDVERVRRAHRNDLENILPFFVIALLYILTNPAAFLAINLIRAFAISRIVHTVVYAVVVVPQPARFLAYIVGVAVSVYMAFQVIVFSL